MAEFDTNLLKDPVTIASPRHEQSWHWSGNIPLAHLWFLQESCYNSELTFCDHLALVMPHQIGGERLSCANISPLVVVFDTKAIRVVIINTMESLIMDLPWSRQSLYNGQAAWHQLKLTIVTSEEWTASIFQTMAKLRYSYSYIMDWLACGFCYPTRYYSRGYPIS